jgi:hypothetical protein
MAIKYQFRGKTVIEPGAYGQFISGIPQRPDTASFGNVMIIDTGSGKYFNGGGAVNGELTSGVNAVYEFGDATSFQKFIGGGLLWDLSAYLFGPSKNGVGAQSLFYIKAATTTAPSFTYTLTGISGGAILSATIVSGTITAINIVNGGSGFGSAPSLSFANVGGGSGASATAVLTNGVITSITSLVGGTGYGANTTVTVTAGSNNGGAFTLKSKIEGIAGNGVLTSGNLSRGVGCKIIAGRIDPTKFIFQFYEGAFKGVNTSEETFTTADYVAATTYAANALVYYDGFVYKSLQSSNTGNSPIAASSTYWAQQVSNTYFGDFDPATTTPTLLAESVEFNLLSDLYTWMANDYNFGQYFKPTSTTIVGTGVIDAADAAANTGYKLATGGTETYSSTDVDAVLANISAVDNTFFLCDQWGDNAQSVTNTKIQAHIVNTAESDKFMFVGGGYDSTKFTQTNGSIPTAQYYNSERAVVVHSGIQMPKSTGGVRNLPSIYNAAIKLGRIAGLAPQTPGTWKDTGIAGVVHELNKTDRERALQAGVLHDKFVPGIGWVINQAINTLQKNTQLINPNGASYEISIERIKAQLNKELVANSQIRFVGGNLRTSSATDIKSFVEGYLLFRTADSSKDDLIISFQSVTVTLSGDAWFVNYGIVVNSPINKVFFQGILLQPNISI